MTQVRPPPYVWPAVLPLLAILLAPLIASTSFAAPKKKPKKTDSTTAAPATSASSSAAPDSTPAPAPTPEPAPSASAADTTPPKSQKAEAAATGSASVTATGKGSTEVDVTDTKEDPNTRYYFVGLRYRGTIIPQFLMNLFVDEGGTIYTNMFGIELDMRKGGQSMIPWIVFADYSMGDTLFHQKSGMMTGVPGDPGNYTVVNSSLKMVYLGLDELWSAPIDDSHHWDFEFGFGVGIGFVFGDLVNNWVYVDNSNGANGPAVKGSNGFYYARCQTMDPTKPGCNTTDHQNATIAKVGGYKEPFWFSGGSVPNIFPNIWFPTLNLRYKPIKQFETRLGVGFSLTGFWIGLSADYGLEKTDNAKASGSLASLRDML
jgi:hypothetical protein